MHPISPEAKKELLEALSMQQDAFSKLEKHGVESVVFGVESAKRIVESFPTSEPDTSLEKALDELPEWFSFHRNDKWYVFSILEGKEYAFGKTPMEAVSALKEKLKSVTG